MSKNSDREDDRFNSASRIEEIRREQGPRAAGIYVPADTITDQWQPIAGQMVEDAAPQTAPLRIEADGTLVPTFGRFDPDRGTWGAYVDDGRQVTYLLGPCSQIRPWSGKLVV